MKNISDEQIKQHIINVVNYEDEFLADRHLINDYKSKILNDRNDDEIDYIAKIIISDMDRHLLNIEKSNFNINEIDFSSLIEYIKSEVFPFKEYLKEAVENKLYKPFMCSENCSEIINMNLFISAIVKNLHILNLVEVSEAMDNAKRRDSEKIKNAIRTLLYYTNDEQVKYYLETIKTQTRDITKSTVLSCIFCDLYKILEEMLSNFSKNIIQKNAAYIMDYVFDSKKEYRYYKNIEHISFKGYKLQKFKAN